MTKSQVKSVADRALSFYNTRDSRTFASVISSKCDRGFANVKKQESAGRSALFTSGILFPLGARKVLASTYGQSHRGVRTNNMRIQSNRNVTGTQNIGYSHVPDTAKETVSNDQVFGVPCTNCFQVLTDMVQDSTCTQGT